MGESAAKNRAVVNKSANMVQNLFSNSWALCTLWDSLNKKMQSVYRRDKMHDQNMGAMANSARNISVRSCTVGVEQ